MIRDLADLEALEAQGLDALYPERSPWEMLQRQARDRPQAIAIRYLRDASDGARDLCIDYATLADRVMGAARLFRSHGVRPDRAVALLTQHTVSGQVALWGAELAGVACPINPLLTPEHIAALIRASDATVVVVTGVNAEIDIWPRLVPALRAQGIDLPIFDCDGDAPSPGSDGCFETLIDRPGAEVKPEGSGQSLAAYYHTGGTTGAPKLVRHLRANQAHVARSCALMHDHGPETVMVNGFPLFHVAGAFVFGLSVLCAGGTLVVPGRLGMRNATFMSGIWQQVERLRVTVIGAVPTVLASLNATPVNADIASLKWLLTGGSPLPTELADAVEQRVGVPLRNILGMTESAGTMAVEPVHGPRKPLSCGLRLPFTEVAVLDPSEGTVDPERRLPAGCTGIIAQRGPNVADGYSDPSRNAGTFLPGGWLVSGDLGRLDGDGRLYITGREKDVIIRGAHNIDPQMIEDALLAHPEVVDAAAVGMPDAYAGELPVAFVTLRSGYDETANGLIDWLRPRLADPVALPKRIGLRGAMPLTPIGKIFKPTLRAEAIRWALSDLAERLGLSVDIHVADSLAATITLAAQDAARFREAMAGMPITAQVIEES